MLLTSCEGGSPDLLKGPEIIVIDTSHEIQVLEICGEDDPFSIALSSEDSLSLTFNLKAVNGISLYTIDIHGNFDCHSHGRLSESMPWRVLLTEEVDGRDKTITETFAVPSNVQAGNYHFILQALDLLGNKAEPLLFSLRINNVDDIQPAQISLIEPQEGSLSISGNETIEVEMKIKDNESLLGGRVDVTYSDPSGTAFTAEQYFFSKADGNEAIYEFSFRLPESANSGSYKFLFTVYDGVGNVSFEEVSVVIKS
ncbi:MAG: DUF4625 domain-containing protein [Cyclobacteriaceae bacterium]